MRTLSIENISCRYRKGPLVLSGFSLEAGAGEVLALLGVNGAGKTTAFRAVVGLLVPEVGSIEVAGISPTSERREANRRLGYVPHESLLYPALSGLENLNMFGLLWDVAPEAIRQKSDTLLQSAGLWEKRNEWVRSYSRGMQQKLSICAALLHQPQVLLLDEPFNNLDMASVLWVRGLLRRLADAGSAIVLSSHLPETVDAVADRVALLCDKRITDVLDRKQVQKLGGVSAVFEKVSQGLASSETRP